MRICKQFKICNFVSHVECRGKDTSFAQPSGISLTSGMSLYGCPEENVIKGLGVHMLISVQYV